MNSYEQKEVTVPDCNQLQNEEKAAAETSHLIAELKKSINKPVRWIQPVEPYQREQEFFIEPKAEYVKALGYNCAILITYLLFRYQPDKDTGKPRLDTQRNGMFYWAETHDDMLKRINESVPYTKDKLRAAIKKAEGKGILEAKPMRYSGKLRIYRGETVMHYRLVIANGAAALSNWPTAESVMRMTLGWDFSIPIGWGFPTPKRKEEEVGKKKNEKIQTAPSSPEPEHTPLTPNQGSGKTKPQNLKTGGQSKHPESGPNKKKKLKPADGHFYNALAEKHDMDVLLMACIDAGLTEPHRKMLHDKAECCYLYPIGQELAKSTLDDSLESLITTVGREWDACMAWIIELDSDIITPDRPNFPFMKKHIIKLFEALAALPAGSAASPLHHAVSEGPDDVPEPANSQAV